MSKSLKAGFGSLLMIALALIPALKAIYDWLTRTETELARMQANGEQANPRQAKHLAVVLGLLEKIAPKAQSIQGVCGAMGIRPTNPDEPDPETEVVPLARAKGKKPMKMKASKPKLARSGDALEGTITIAVAVDKAVISSEAELVEALQSMLGNRMVQRTLRSRGVEVGAITATLS